MPNNDIVNQIRNILDKMRTPFVKRGKSQRGYLDEVFLKAKQCEDLNFTNENGANIIKHSVLIILHQDGTPKSYRWNT